MKLKKIISVLLLSVTAISPVTIGNYTASYGEIEIVGNKAEVNVVGTGQGFVIKNKNYKECRDYIVIINNRGTKSFKDDRIVRLIEVKNI